VWRRILGVDGVGVREIIPIMVRVTVRLPKEQAAALQRAARRRGVSRAAVVREALSKLLGPELRRRDDAGFAVKP
jgi:predicted transcriptional regulator